MQFIKLSSIKLCPLLIMLSMVVLQCQKESSAYHDVAQDFIQTYYLQVDPAKALEMTQGLAAQKLRRELELLRGLLPSQAKERPQISFQIHSCQRDSGAKASCNYELDIQGERSFKRKGYLTLRLDGGRWQVTQFREFLED